MKNIKNLSFNEDILPHIVAGFICIGITGSTIGYYTYESKTQIIEDYISKESTFMDENGNICHYFDVGEHRITISRNDAYHHKYKEIEGYTIETVEIKGWRDNSKVTYINNSPVIAKATKITETGIEFSDFGTCVELDKKYYK